MSPANLAVQQAYESYRRGAFDDTRRQLEKILSGPLFEQLDPPLRHGVVGMASFLALQAGDAARAYALAVRGTQMSPPFPRHWFIRFNSAFELGDFADAVTSLTMFAQQAPQDLALLDAPRVYRMSAVAPAVDAHQRMLQSLFDAGWQPRFGGEPSRLWMKLAVMLLENGDVGAAGRVIARIGAPETVIRMRADRRFDALRAQSPARFDVSAIAEAEIALLKQQAAAAPDNLQPRTLLLQALRTADRCNEALELADEVLARTGGLTAEQKPYVDGGAYLDWLLDNRSSVLACLGRRAEALSQLKRASNLQERGHQNTSQTINLAGMYGWMGQPADALEALKHVGGTSAFGRMQIETVRVLAAVQLGDQQMAATALTYLRTHRNDALDALQDALLIAGARDEAAELIVQRLGNVAERSDALFYLQIFPDDSPQTPAELKWQAAKDALRQDWRVVSAVERVGRVESYPHRQRQ